jgi:tetratricopeptide (TPR) repeat protein
MGCSSAVSHQFKVADVIRRVSALIILSFLFPALHAQEAASLRGAVRDSSGTPVAGANVELRAKDATEAQTVRADGQGHFTFSAMHGGVYTLRATMPGYSDAGIASLFFAPHEVKTVDLTLLGGNIPAFFEKPQFTVSGVTDTTNLGGHGSGPLKRTRDALAKETFSLGNSSPNSEPASETEKSLRANLERNPTSFELNHLLGKVLLESGKAREGIPYLERATQLAPSGNETVYENAYDLARANLQAGDYARARDSAQSLLAHSDQAALHHLLADADEKLGNSLDAVREYQRAADLGASEAYVFDWGSELLLHHAPEPAAEVFSRGNRLFPRSTRMLVGWATALFAGGSLEEAVERISEASDLNPNDSTPYRFMGAMQSSTRIPSEKIVERLHRFVTLEPDNAEANYHYAAVLWKLRKPGDAASVTPVESFLKKAILLDSGFAAAYLQLGILHFEQKNYTQAVSDYQHAIKADPERQLEEPHYRLAQAYRHLGDNAKAAAEIQIYDQIVKESAQQAERERHEIPQFVYALRDPSP